MKIIRKAKPQPEDIKVSIGDIFERINKVTHGNDLYLVIHAGAHTFGLLNLTNHTVYSFPPVNSPNDVFGLQKHTFIKVTEPVEIIVG